MGAGPLPKTVGQVRQASHMERSHLGFYGRSTEGSALRRRDRAHGKAASRDVLRGGGEDSFTAVVDLVV